MSKRKKKLIFDWHYYCRLGYVSWWVQQGVHWKWGDHSGQQQRQEDEKTSNNLFIAPNPTIGATIYTSSVLGIARSSWTGIHTRIDANSGRLNKQKFFVKILCRDLGSTGSSCQTPSRHLSLLPTLTRLISPLSAPTKKTNQSQVFTVKKSRLSFF